MCSIRTLMEKYMKFAIIDILKDRGFILGGIRRLDSCWDL